MAEQEWMVPPQAIPESERGNWFTLPEDDPVVAYWTESEPASSGEPGAWQVTRLSNAVYLYREPQSQAAVAAKFYRVKTGDMAGFFAEQEYRWIQRAHTMVLDSERFGVVRVFALWKGVLFLEYIQGLTLDDLIAVRRSRPGRLGDCLETVAAFLAQLHARSREPDTEPNLGFEIEYGRKLLNTLAEHGVLRDDPGKRQHLEGLVEQWEHLPAMQRYTPVFCHGDATTSNFIFTEQGRMTAIDWERARVMDAASDVGRLMAEVGNSLLHFGARPPEVHPFLDHILDSYQSALPAGVDRATLAERTRFYQAVSSLRIARNGWLHPTERWRLIDRAVELLTL